MKATVILTFLLACTIGCAAQEEKRPFEGYLHNDEYQIYLKINLHDNDIDVPNHELFGPLPGYLGKLHNNFYWLVTSAKIKSKNKAEISLINDYGSEDLTATLTMKNDSTYILKQEDGSTLKVPNNGKWQKVPSTLEMKRK